jgi:tight adherence protein C
MQGIFEFLSALTDEFQLTRTTLVLIIGGVAALFAGAIFYIVAKVNDPRNKRLGAIIHEDDANSAFSRFSSSVESISAPKKDAERKGVARQLIMAGYRSTNSLSTFYAIKLVLTIGLGGAVLVTLALVPHPLPMNQILFAGLMGAAAGLLIPSIFLEKRVAYRQRQIMRGIPDALDLLVTCTEAGLGLNQALQRVADEIRVGYPELSGELDVVNAEIGAGVDRSQALAGLHERTGLGEIRGLVSMFNQTMRFGTSIADALRMYAEEFRDRRTQAAEEKAAKLGTKMIFPLVFCFFPAFFVVAIGPAGMKIIRAFSQMEG